MAAASWVQSTAVALPGLNRCNPNFAACSSQTKPNSLCWHLQVDPQLSCSADVAGQTSPTWYKVWRLQLDCFCPVCNLKWKGFHYFFFYKPMMSSFFGENITNLHAVWCSLIQFSDKLFAPGQHFCNLCSIFVIPEGLAPSLAAVICQRGDMKSTHAMESCSPSFLPVFRCASCTTPDIPSWES